MKKVTLAFVTIALAVLLLPSATNATLSSKTIRGMYKYWWNRNPRGDELIFHLQNRTSMTQLDNWLRSQTNNLRVNKGSYYQKISSFDGQLISTPANVLPDVDASLYFVQDGKRYRVYDYPTAVAWGLNLRQRIPLPGFLYWMGDSNIYPTHLRYILSTIPEGAPLQFANGHYAKYVREIIAGDRTTVSEESDAINTFLNNSACLLTSESCDEWNLLSVRYDLQALYDWSWRNVRH